jgi:hypothetical protein
MVLVIIGLIVGGILVGQDLIRASEVRATAGQIEKYNTAVATFGIKYNGLPGDLDSSAASTFGMEPRTGAEGHGDGNARLDGCSSGALVFGCETALIWRDLSLANLIDGSFISATDALTAVAAGSQSAYFPAAKVGRGNYITVFVEGSNYYELTGIVSTDASGVYTLANALTPQEALNMDEKIDDGKPLAGMVQATEGPGPLNTTAVPGAATCVFTGGAQYNVTTAELAATPLCHLRFRFD